VPGRVRCVFEGDASSPLRFPRRDKSGPSAKETSAAQADAMGDGFAGQEIAAID
jgi:hypothetical protein